MSVFEWLDESDLFEVANTCKHFHALATRVFHARNKNDEFYFPDLMDNGYLEPSLSHYVHFIRTFMPKRIEIAGRRCENQDIQLRTIIEHCTDLELLSMLGCKTIRPDTLEALRPLLSRLKELSIHAKCLPLASDVIGWSTEHLCICFDSETPVLDIKLLRLTALTFFAGTDDSNDALVFGLLANHPHIDALNFNSHAISSNVLCTLTDYVPNITSLSLTWCNVASIGDKSVGTFKCLKKCCIEGDVGGDVKALLRLLQGSPIERLILKNVDDVEFIEAIRGFTTITHLTVESVYLNIDMTEYQWIQLAKAPNQLQSLRIGSDKLFPLDCVKDILEHSATLEKLVIRNWNEQGPLKLITAECDAISTLIAARPGLSVRIVFYLNETEVSQTH